MVYFLVGITGALGAILRYWIGLWLFKGDSFPFSTLTINLIGSFLLAWFTTNLFKRVSLPPMIATAIGTGFVGSFTTFSTLSVETVQLFHDGKVVLGVLYVAISVIGGLIMSRLGFKYSEVVQKS
ncbi:MULTISPECIES: fluoride efflux transporter CrcB [Neobacillus]|uniref:Fluoride-specific ion channel FluC n=1 Tax=Neobacillus rhizophilus TaxID=2833579 RepID=A0A942YSU2_9BACI|nr:MULTISPECIES: fluoride efflux transporter CrcB [Neobacillus]MBS4211212.1 fluoride efflux transporter CrcB [Neobacillus rhizophilus]MBU8918736.1 fluoride efflux transporter CrcB [Bacillus sp. FJAT-29953]